MAGAPYGSAPPGASFHNPELETARTLLSVSRILAPIIAGLFALAALFALLAAVVHLYPGGLFDAVFYAVCAFVDLLAFGRIGEIRGQVDSGRIQEAKEGTLLWAVLGLIFGGIILGLLLILAYIQHNDAMNRMRQGMTPGGGGPSAPAQAPPTTWTPSPGAPGPGGGAPVATPPLPSASPATPLCPRCGRPGTWIAQYQRWYCYTDQLYL